MTGWQQNRIRRYFIAVFSASVPLIILVCTSKLPAVISLLSIIPITVGLVVGGVFLGEATPQEILDFHSKK